MKIALCSFLFIFGSALIYSFSFRWTRINNISFAAQNLRLEEEDKIKLINELKEQTRPFLGAWFWHLSIQKLHQMVQNHPQVEEVKVRRAWPNRFFVLLLSSEPLLLLMGHKVFYPVTNEGKLLSPLVSSNLPDLPLLRGDAFRTNAILRKKAVQLFQYLPKEGFFSQRNISEIKYSTKDSNFYLYLVYPGSMVRVGESLSEFRPDRVEKVLSYLEQKKINWRVIDARYSQKVVVSLVKGI